MIIMLFVIVVIVLVMFLMFIMIIMLFVIVVIVLVMFIMVVMFIMAMIVERAAFTEPEGHQPATFHQRYRHCFRCDAVNRLLQKRLKIMAHPENKVSLLQLFGL